jgi:plasmid stabilization system protein ParE
MKISWTPTARLTYFKVLEYLSKDWTIKEVENFIYKTEHTIAQIAQDPYMFKASRKKINVRKGFITEHNSLYYRVKPIKKEIELITFWDNRRDPLKIRY